VPPTASYFGKLEKDVPERATELAWSLDDDQVPDWAIAP
jgi:hypothetical protein